MILDLFAGIGGWHAAMPPEQRIAIEWDRDATRTLRALGVPVIRADVAAYPAEVFAGQVEGITASPPCQSFSRAGKRGGLDDPRGQLVFEPLRWARAVRPRWMACEQVPDVLGIWHDLAFDLRAEGYRTWAGVLSAERYGVPQTRDRAILLASLDRQPFPPEPTHQEYRPGEAAEQGEPDLFGGAGLLPWVSMAVALGWHVAGQQHMLRGAGMTERHGERSERTLEDPVGRDVASWGWERPATTVMADPRIAGPGHKGTSFLSHDTMVKLPRRLAGAGHEDGRFQTVRERHPAAPRRPRTRGRPVSLVLLVVAAWLGLLLLGVAIARAVQAMLVRRQGARR